MDKNIIKLTDLVCKKIDLSNTEESYSRENISNIISNIVVDEKEKISNVLDYINEDIDATAEVLESIADNIKEENIQLEATKVSGLTITSLHELDKFYNTIRDTINKINEYQYIEDSLIKRLDTAKEYNSYVALNYKHQDLLLKDYIIDEVVKNIKAKNSIEKSAEEENRNIIIKKREENLKDIKEYYTDQLTPHLYKRLKKLLVEVLDSGMRKAQLSEDTFIVEAYDAIVSYDDYKLIELLLEDCKNNKELYIENAKKYAAMNGEDINNIDLSYNDEPSDPYQYGEYDFVDDDDLDNCSDDIDI